MLTAYFKMYVRVAGGGTYIDAFAGSGYATINGEETMGSALRAATSGAFRELFFVEKDRATHDRLLAAVASLDERRRDRITVVSPASDCNVAIPRLLESGTVDRDRPCFALLDPNSTELAWSTVEALARYKTYEPPPEGETTPRRCKVELWVLVSTHHALGRLMPSDRIKHRVPPHAEVLDFVMGGRDAWWDVWTRPYGGPGLLAHRYEHRLRDVLGYKWTHAQLVTDPDSNRPQYYMVHASDHPNAHSLMRSAKRSRMSDPPQFRGMSPRPDRP